MVLMGAVMLLDTFGYLSIENRWPLLLFACSFLLLFMGMGISLMVIRRERKEIRFDRGLCPTCSYDLRAHSPNSNCPECGTPIPATSQEKQSVKSV
jgi:hypothetical protein